MGPGYIQKAIKSRRIKLGLTMLDVSKAVGVSEATVSRWESGDIENMKADKIELLAKVLQLPPAELMGWEDTGESVSSIINGKLEETGVSLEQIADKANVPLYWLQNIDSFTPGEWGGDNDIAYKWISNVAEALNVPSAKLRIALARQEIPTYDGPYSTPEQDFFDTVDFNSLTDNSIFEEQLKQIGYSIGFYEDDAYMWINYPDGTLEITMDQLDDLRNSSKTFLKFQLDELKKNNIKDFKKK